MGAPVQYARGGQSESARRRMIPHRFTQSRLRRAMFEKPELIRESFKRISWSEVVEQCDPKHRETLSGRISFYEFQSIVPKKLWLSAAFALLDANADMESLTSAVESCWIANATFFMATAGDELLPMLRRCRFKMPAETPDEFDIWRGVRGISLEHARGGACWSTRRETACQWMMHIGVKDGERVDGAPLLVRRRVRRSEILLFTDEHHMSEAVIAPGGTVGEVDGDSAEWLSTAKAEARRVLLSDGLRQAEVTAIETARAMGACDGYALTMTLLGGVR